MSATFEIYRVRPDVNYLSSPFYDVVFEKGWKVISETRENELLRQMVGAEKTAELGLEHISSADVFSDDKLYNLYNSCFEDRFSVEGNFQVLFKQDLRRLGKARKSVRTFDNWLERKGLYKTLKFPSGATIKYVTVECLRHEQGFYFRTKRWVKSTRGIMINFYKSKRAMIKFIGKVFNLGNERAYRAFLNLSNTWDKNAESILFFRASF